MIRQLKEDEKTIVARKILEALPEWFGIPEARENYISKSADQITFGAFEGEQPVGFLCLEETGKNTMELYCLGVLKEYHRKGIGTKSDLCNGAEIIYGEWKDGITKRYGRKDENNRYE